MTSYDRFTILLSAISILFIPTLILMVRIITKWTRTEDKLDNLMQDVNKLVADKDQTHREMLAQMREDRNATNIRLRYLEEHFWGRNHR